MTDLNTDKPITERTPIWLPPADMATLLGTSKKTLVRAIQTKQIRYRLVHNRYQVELVSAIRFCQASIKLRNKLDKLGFGQLVAQWRDL
ncbi:MAG: hypothetical protein WCK11_04725 [Candidatus Falkowbacteria bacterium]